MRLNFSGYGSGNHLREKCVGFLLRFLLSRQDMSSSYRGPLGVWLSPSRVSLGGGSHGDKWKMCSRHPFQTIQFRGPPGAQAEVATEDRANAREAYDTSAADAR